MHAGQKARAEHGQATRASTTRARATRPRHANITSRSGALSESGKVEEKAREAEKALDSDQQELERAEAIGKRHSHGEDPALKKR